MNDELMNDKTCEPRFSVVIPVFNAERYVGETIQSVLNQSYPATEIIVVDDGSMDGTAQVVRDFSRQFPISYTRQDNQGPSVARNRGVAVAKGNWIAFLDADDVWHPAKLATHRDYINAYPNVVLFWSDWNYIDEQGYPKDPVTRNAPLCSIIFGHPIFPIPSSVVIRKEVFEQTDGFNPGIRCHEDTEFFARVATQFSIELISRILVKYRCHEEQLHLNPRCSADNWPVVSQSLSLLWHDNPSKRAVLAEQSAIRYTRIGRHWLRAGDYEQARHFFRQSFTQKPFYWTNLRRWALSYLPGVRRVYHRAKRHTVRV